MDRFSSEFPGKRDCAVPTGEVFLRVPHANQFLVVSRIAPCTFGEEASSLA